MTPPSPARSRVRAVVRALTRPRLAALLAFLLANALGQVAFFRWRLDAVLGAVLEVDGQAAALRQATMGYVLYGAAALAGAVLAAFLVLGAHRRLRGAATGVAVFLATAATVCVYIETTVFKDHGVHFYEFDLVGLVTNAWIARDFGIRPQDLVFALGVGAVLVVVEAAFFVALRRAAARRPGMGPWSLAGLGVLGLGGLLLYGGRQHGVTVDRHEFMEALPLRAVLLMDDRYRPHIPVAPRLGRGGYPVAGAVEPPVLSEPRNLVVWVGDGLRADHVTPELAPHLTAFGRRPDVVVPRRTYSTGHATEIGFFGLLFGLDAYHYHAFAEHHVRPWPLEVLEANGYVTALVAGSRFNKYPTDFLAEAFGEVHYPEDDDEALAVAERFVEARRADGRPYLLVVFYYTPHYPFASTEPHNLRHEPYLVQSERSPFVSFDDPDFQVRARNSYSNAVLQADEYFRDTWALVRDDFEAGRTAFVATSDHGTEFWEHGLFGHGRSTFWNEKVLVPAFVGVPGAGTPAGDPPVASLKDVWPTLMEWLSPRPAMPAASWSDGLSLLSTPPGVLAARRDVFVSGRYFPWANRPNLLVDGDRKRWFHVAGVGPGGRLRVDEDRTTDLFDRPVASDGVPAGLMRSFEERFWRFLAPAPREPGDPTVRAGVIGGEP